MSERETTTPAPLYGLRCGDELHRGHGTVYLKSEGRHQIEGFITSNRCYELVISHDGGQTWHSGPRSVALAEVADERARQDTKWGEQNHPDGTGGGNTAAAAIGARLACQLAAKEGTVTWRDIMREEVGEAFAETDPAKLRAELIQVAAVAVAWAEAIDRRLHAEAVSQ